MKLEVVHPDFQRGCLLYQLDRRSQLHIDGKRDGRAEGGEAGQQDPHGHHHHGQLHNYEYFIFKRFTLGNGMALTRVVITLNFSE